VKKIVVAVIAVGFAGVVLYFWERAPFLWHWRHGFHADVHSIKFRIPLHYYVEPVAADGTTIIVGHARNFSTDPARFHYGAIFISEGLMEPEDPRALLPPEGSFVRIGDRTLVLAGVQGRCSEYEGSPERGRKTITIMCSFQNRLHVMFSGTPPAVPDFYDILGSARKIEENAR
jgi:hypothetical protein